MILALKGVEPMRSGLRVWWIILGLLSIASARAQGSLRIGIQDEPDVLDPMRSDTFAGRLVFASVCDKLIDTSPTLDFVPQLANGWSWSQDGLTLTLHLRPGVSFQDGTAMDAEAVRANLERYRTAPNSVRKAELKPVSAVTTPDPLTVEVHLTQRYAPLLAVLADRAGMMMSPATFADGKVPDLPVCAGPFKVTQRVAQDRIVLDRFPGYWNAGAYHFDHVVYLPIPDAAVRLANLRSGDLDMIEHLAPTDVAAARAMPALEVLRVAGLGYMNVLLNVGNGARAKTPFGSDSRVRQAFELSIDRDALNQVVFSGLYEPDNQPFPPASPYYDKALPIRARDVDHARSLLKQAGVAMPFPLELLVANDSVTQQTAQVIQAMAAEAGFDVQLRVTEFATLLREQQQGSYQASMLAWSGRIDPDGNIHQFATCHGSINVTGYCNPEVDRLLDEARVTTDEAKRRALYDQAMAPLLSDLPQLYLYAEPRLFALTRRLHGFVPHPDGLIRLQNVSRAD